MVWRYFLQLLMLWYVVYEGLLEIMSIVTSQFWHYCLIKDMHGYYFDTNDDAITLAKEALLTK